MAERHGRAGGSTIRFYVDRFRHAAPAAPAERRQDSMQQESAFWWKVPTTEDNRSVATDRPAGIAASKPMSSDVLTRALEVISSSRKLFQEGVLPGGAGGIESAATIPEKPSDSKNAGAASVRHGSTRGIPVKNSEGSKIPRAPTFSSRPIPSWAAARHRGPPASYSSGGSVAPSTSLPIISAAGLSRASLGSTVPPSARTSLETERRGPADAAAGHVALLAMLDKVIGDATQSLAVPRLVPSGAATQSANASHEDDVVSCSDTASMTSAVDQTEISISPPSPAILHDKVEGATPAAAAADDPLSAWRRQGVISAQTIPVASVVDNTHTRASSSILLSDRQQLFSAEGTFQSELYPSSAEALDLEDPSVTIARLRRRLVAIDRQAAPMLAQYSPSFAKFLALTGLSAAPALKTSAAVPEPPLIPVATLKEADANSVPVSVSALPPVYEACSTAVASFSRGESIADRAAIGGTAAPRGTIDSGMRVRESAASFLWELSEDESDIDTNQREKSMTSGPLTEQGHVAAQSIVESLEHASVAQLSPPPERRDTLAASRDVGSLSVGTQTQTMQSVPRELDSLIDFSHVAQQVAPTREASALETDAPAEKPATTFITTQDIVAPTTETASNAASVHQIAVPLHSLPLPAVVSVVGKGFDSEPPAILIFDRTRQAYVPAIFDFGQAAISASVERSHPVSLGDRSRSVPLAAPDESAGIAAPSQLPAAAVVDAAGGRHSPCGSSSDEETGASSFSTSCSRCGRHEHESDSCSCRSSPSGSNSGRTSCLSGESYHDPIYRAKPRLSYTVPVVPALFHIPPVSAALLASTVPEYHGQMW